MRWRLFCCNRRTPLSVSRPVMKNDLLMSVEKPSTMTPRTWAPDQQVGVLVIGTDGGLERLGVEPRRGGIDLLEEVAKRRGSLSQFVRSLLDPGLDQQVALLAVERSQRGHGRIGRGIADHRMLAT